VLGKRKRDEKRKQRGTRGMRRRRGEKEKK
jgi:hypothetical protein